MTAHLIDDPAEALDALSSLTEPVALDTEFHSEHRYHPKLMVLQVRGAGGPAHLLDGRRLEIGPLAAALSGLSLIAHAPGQDLAILRRHGLEPGPVTDTQVLAGFRGLGFPRSLGDLLRDVLGHAPAAGATLSDWSKRPLGDRQLAYAADDVLQLHDLAEALAPDDPSAVQACTDELLAPLDPDRAWERIRAIAVLSASDRATLQRLAAWRERTAQELDQPLFQVASDGSLIDLARRRPASVEQMKENRRFSKRLANTHGATLLPLLEGPSGEAWPYLERAREAAAVLTLQAFAARYEVTDGIAARLILPDASIGRVISAIQAGLPPASGLAAWRRDRLEAQLSRFVTSSNLLDLLRFETK